MELRHLRYFVAVAEEENVSRAALKLHVSQPGISHQIHDLEDDLGFALFHRSGKSVRLTVAGKIFLREARDILRRTAIAVEKARAVVVTSKASLSVGYIPSGTVEILPRALRGFRDAFPSIHVTTHDLSAEEMLPLLLRKKLDIALTVVRGKLPRGIEVKEIARYRTCVAVGATHPLAKSKFASLEKMASDPIAAYTRKDYLGYHKHLEMLFATIGRKPRIGSEHDSGSSLIAALAAGNEFALLPSCVTELAGPRLKLLNVRPALPPWVIVALWRKDAATEPLRAFIAAALKRST